MMRDVQESPVQRRRSRKLMLAASTALVMALSVVAAGCGSTNSSGAEGDKTLRVAVAASVSLDPALTNQARGDGPVLISPAYAALFHHTPSGKIEPALATSWKYVNGGDKPNQVFEFTLRPDAKFSDGSPVTADAVVKSFKYFASRGGPFSNSLGSDTKFTVIDPRKVRIELGSPNPSLPEILSDQGNNVGFIINPKLVADPKLISSGTYGAGPYKLDASQTVRDDHYTFVPNEHFYDQNAIRFDRIEVKVIANASSRLQAQQSGQFDVALGDTTTMAAAEQAGLKVVSAPKGVFFLDLDLVNESAKAPELKNVLVRRAMNYAINREAIAKGLFDGAGQPAENFLTSDMDTSPYTVHYDYDPAKAKQLLAQAGYPNGFKSKAICASFLGAYGTPLIEAAARDLQAVGIELDITCYPTTPAFSAANRQREAGVFLIQQDSVATPSVYGVFLVPGGFQFFGTDKIMESNYEKGAASEEPEQYWGKMWERFTSQAYTVPLVTRPSLYYVSKGIGGVELSDTHSASLPTEWRPTGS